MISKFQVGFKSLLRQGLSEPDFYGDLVYKLKKIVGSNNFSAQFRLFAGPTGVYLLDFFCSGIQFNLLLSPYPCFISLLYLDLYVLGDDALIS